MGRVCLFFAEELTERNGKQQIRVPGERVLRKGGANSHSAPPLLRITGVDGNKPEGREVM